ncbi:DMT family transporter [Brevibacillus sp. SYP-B805]|uniref:DMT family transporter n=1 Tax=Brevibacillus sp. SYP-B805 TaxID=1578199 RepID=UPI0013EB3DE5|nr:DMT family transporter [Brevibacillus sp. SYP-B805]NGQ94888.1 DMT family transporter [Brevibacillus sp. SYP-B805]
MNQKHLAWVLLVLTNLFWAGNYVFGKYVTAEISPVWITFSRWVLALCALLPMAMLLEKPDWQAVRRAWLPLLGMGLLGVVGYNLLLYEALAFTSPLNAALVNSLNPALIVLFSAYLLRERMTGGQYAGLALSLVGVLITITRGDVTLFARFQLNRGDLLMLLAITVWTLYSVLGKRLAHIPPITTTAVSALWAVLLLLPFAALNPLSVGQISSLSLIGILYMAVFPSVGSYLLWNMAVRVTGANQAGVTLHLIPVFTALLGFALGDGVSAAQLIGGLLVCTGVLLTTGLIEQRLKKAKPAEHV